MKLFDTLFGRRQTPAPAPAPAPRPLPELAAEKADYTVTLTAPGTTAMRHIIAPVPKELFEKICGIALDYGKKSEEVVLDLLTKELQYRYDPEQSSRRFEKVNVALLPQQKEHLSRAAQSFGYRSHLDFAKDIIMSGHNDCAKNKVRFRLSSRAYMRSCTSQIMVEDFPADYLELLHTVARNQHSSMRRVASSFFKIGYDNFFGS